MATDEQKQIWLTQAEDALHQLSMGSRVVEVSYQGRTIEYTQTSAMELRAYIRDLQVQLGIKTGRVGPAFPRF